MPTEATIVALLFKTVSKINKTENKNFFLFSMIKSSKKYKAHGKNAKANISGFIVVINFKVIGEKFNNENARKIFLLLNLFNDKIFFNPNKPVK